MESFLVKWTSQPSFKMVDPGRLLCRTDWTIRWTGICGTLLWFRASGSKLAAVIVGPGKSEASSSSLGDCLMVSSSSESSFSLLLWASSLSPLLCSSWSYKEKFETFQTIKEARKSFFVYFCLFWQDVITLLNISSSKTKDAWSAFSFLRGSRSFESNHDCFSLILLCLRQQWFFLIFSWK